MNENGEKSDKLELNKSNTHETFTAPRQVGVGLRGLTNSDSLNTILQVLFHINFFRHHVFYLRQSTVSNSLIALEIQKIFIQLNIKSGSPPSVKNLLLKMKIPPDELEKNNDPILFLQKFYNIFRNDIFFRNLFIGFVSKIHETAYFLSLSLNVEMGDDIEKIFSEMYSDLHFDRFPPIIFLNLDRYRDDYVNHKTVSFPKNLNFEKYTNRKPSPNYELYSVIVHSGMNKNGHFFVYIYDANSENWVLYDDSKVQIVPPNIAIEENFGGNERQFSAKVLIYFDVSMKNILFEQDNDDFAVSLIVDQFASQESNKSSNQSALSNNKNKDYKINVVVMDDIDKYVDSESNIKFTSDRYISINQNDTVKELYIKMARFLHISSDKLTIWIFFHSVPCLKIPRNYDNEKLINLVDSLKYVQFFVETPADEEEEEEEEEEEVDLDKSKKGSTPKEKKKKKEGKEKGKEKEKEDENNSENDENSIMIFLFTYNYMNTQPLSFYGTVLVSFNEDIQSIFDYSRENCKIKTKINMIVFHLIDSKCYLIPDPLKTFGDLEMNDGSIIIVQPDPNFAKGNNSSRPKKPKSSHGIFTYCPDYISTLPHSFSIYYEYRKDPYILPVKFNSQKKMVQFPKGIMPNDFTKFVLKAFNYDLKLNESILFYSKNATKPIEFASSFRIGDQLNKLEMEEDLSQLYLVKIFSNEIYKYRNMVRLKIKMSTTTKKKGLTGFFDKQMKMIDVVNDLKRRHEDLASYFILPLSSSSEIIPENFVIEYIQNPIYFHLRSPTNSELIVTMILIVNGKEIKEIDIPVNKEDTFLDFKNKIKISDIKDARLYTIDDNGNQKSINDSQLMKKFRQQKRMVCLEAPNVPSISVRNMVCRPLSNINYLTYANQIYPTQIVKSEPNRKKYDNNSDNDETKNKNEFEISNFNNFFNDNDAYELEYENDRLLITDQLVSNDIKSNELNLIDNSMREKFQNFCITNQIPLLNDDIHLLYIDNVVSLFSGPSQLEDIDFNKDELMRSYYYQKTKKNTNNVNVTDDETNDIPSDVIIADEKRSRGRPKKTENFKSESDEENNKNEEKIPNEKIESNESNENIQSMQLPIQKVPPVKKIHVKEQKNDEVINDIGIYNSDIDVNYDEDNDGDDDDDDDDDEIAEYDLKTYDDDDYDIDYEENDEEDDNYHSKKSKKQGKTKKSKKKSDDKRLSYTMNTLFAQNGSSSFFPSNNPMLVPPIAIVGGSPQMRQRLQNALSGQNDHEKVVNIIKQVNNPVFKKHRGKMEANEDSSQYRSAHQRIIQGGGSGSSSGGKVQQRQIPQLQQGSFIRPQQQQQQKQQRREAPPFPHVPEMQQESQQQQNVILQGIHQAHVQPQIQQAQSQSQNQSQAQSQNSVVYKIQPPLNPLRQQQQQQQQSPQYQNVQQQQQQPPQYQNVQQQQSPQYQNVQQQQQQKSSQYQNVQQQQPPQYQNVQQQQQPSPQYQNVQQQQLQQSSQYQNVQQQQQPSSQYQNVQQQPQQPPQYQNVQQQSRPHPQPQIHQASQSQSQQQNVQIYSYSRHAEGQPQKGSDAVKASGNGGEMSDQASSKKKRPFRAASGMKPDQASEPPGSSALHQARGPARSSMADDMVSSNGSKMQKKLASSDEIAQNNSNSNNNGSRGRVDSEADFDMSQVKSKYPQIPTSGSKDDLPVSSGKKSVEKSISITASKVTLRNTESVGFIRDPANRNKKMQTDSSSSTATATSTSEYMSDASSRLQFPSSQFKLLSFKLMPTRELNMGSGQNDENSHNMQMNRGQRDQNNRNRQNDPVWSQNSKCSDFSQSNDDFFHLL